MQTYFVHPKDLTVLTEMLDLHLWSDDDSNETENLILKIEPGTLIPVIKAYSILKNVSADEHL